MAASLAYGHVNYAAPWFAERPVTGAARWHDPAQSRPFSGQCVGLSRRALSIAGYMDPRFKGYGFEHIEHTIRLSRYGFGVGMRDPEQPASRLFYLIDGGVSVLASESHGTGELVEANAPIFGGSDGRLPISGRLADSGTARDHAGRDGERRRRLDVVGTTGTSLPLCPRAWTVSTPAALFLPDAA